MRVAWLVGKGVPRERARDLFCEALVACSRRTTPPARPGKFAETVVENLLKQYLRDEKPRVARQKSLPDQLPATGATPLDQVWAHELREQAEAVLAELPARPAQVGRLLVDGWSVGDIAGELGIAPSTLRSHAAVAREALGALVERLGL